MPVVLKRWSVPTGEPDNTERVPSGSVGGRGKRSVSYLARGLPNLAFRLPAAADAQRSAFCAMQLRGLHLSGTLVRCGEIKEVVCSKALKVCIGMARLN